MKFAQIVFLLLLMTSCDSELVEIVADENSSIYDRLYEKTELSLQTYGYPVEREGNTAVVKDQFMVLHIGDEVDQADEWRERAQAAFPGQFSGYKTCGCNSRVRLEVWQIDGIDGTERGKSGRSKVASQIGREEDDVLTNAYIFPNRPDGSLAPGAYDQLPPNFQVYKNQNNNEPLTVAILDSGIDPGMQDHNIPGHAQIPLWENPQEQLDGADQGNDSFCYVDDLIGWDFINDDNNPMDDNSHGTHVAGIYADAMQANAPGLSYEIMPLKVLDHNGVGTTFEAICALLYAAEQGADIINLSWGFVGDENKQLTRAMNVAIGRGATLVASAGNDQINLSYIHHWPSSYSVPGRYNLEGVVFAAASTDTDQLWPNSNFRTIAPGPGGLIAPLGEDVTSLIPTDLQGMVSPVKSGTSMATPVLAALATEYRHLYPDHSPGSVRYNLYYLIREGVHAGQITVDGQPYDFQVLDWIDIASLYDEHSEAMRTD